MNWLDEKWRSTDELDTVHACHFLLGSYRISPHSSRNPELVERKKKRGDTRLFVTTDLIRKAFQKDEFHLIIIYGPLRWGKSSLAMQILHEVYDTWNPENLSKYVGFHPAQVLRDWSSFNEKIMAYVWDDAGLWLHALDWNSPFVKATGKYLNVAGTDFGGLILTSPLPTWISAKVRGIPQAVSIKIKKVAGNKWQQDLRRGTAYRWWMAPDMKHSGVYKPRRDYYAKLAKKLMRENLKSLPPELAVPEYGQPEALSIAR